MGEQGALRMNQPPESEPQPKEPPSRQEALQAWHESGQTFFRQLGETVRHTHAGFALVGASMISRELRRALLAKMRPLSQRRRNELFNGFGPLSTFAARIAVAFALGIISAEIRNEIDVIRNIRNKFAHSTATLNFNSPEILASCRRLSTFDPAQTDFLTGAYLASLTKVVKSLDDFIMDETANK